MMVLNVEGWFGGGREVMEACPSKESARPADGSLSRAYKRHKASDGKTS